MILGTRKKTIWFGNLQKIMFCESMNDDSENIQSGNDEPGNEEPGTGSGNKYLVNILC
jgi:hypothetical protein